jgi:hypothetical protein
MLPAAFGASGGCATGRVPGHLAVARLSRRDSLNTEIAKGHRGPQGLRGAEAARLACDPWGRWRNMGSYGRMAETWTAITGEGKSFSSNVLSERRQTFHA